MAFRKTGKKEINGSSPSSIRRSSGKKTIGRKGQKNPQLTTLVVQGVGIGEPYSLFDSREKQMENI